MGFMHCRALSIQCWHSQSRTRRYRPRASQREWQFFLDEEKGALFAQLNGTVECVMAVTTTRLFEAIIIFLRVRASNCAIGRPASNIPKRNKKHSMMAGGAAAAIGSSHSKS
jgi:hypothetical protein